MTDNPATMKHPFKPNLASRIIVVYQRRLARADHATNSLNRYGCGTDQPELDAVVYSKK